MIKPLEKLTLLLATFGLSACVFMQVLDYSIANVAIPYIAGDLGVSNNDGTWVITLFAVGNAIALPLTGFLTKRFGPIRVMVTSTILFTIMSLICGMSWSFPMLIAARFLQGFVAGPLIPLSQSLLLMSYPKEKKNLALALWTMVALVGPISGPILGGYLTESYSWPWIFYVNLPVGLFSSLIVWKIFKTSEIKGTKTKVDWQGLCFLAVGVTLLQIILDRGEELDWFRSKTIIAMAIISVIAIICLIIWEKTEKNPIIEFSLFKNRNFLFGTILVSLSYMLLFGIIVITPLWLQTQMGYTALASGLAVSTMGLLPLVAAPLVAKLMDRMSLRYLLAFSFLAFGLTSLYFSTFTPQVSFQKIATSRFYFGIGICTWLAPLTGLAFAQFPHDKLASGQGIFHFFRILCGGIGTSIFTTVWNRREAFHQTRLGSALTAFSENSEEAIAKLAPFGEKSKEMINQEVVHQAYMLSTNDIFWASGWIFIAFMLLTFVFKKRSKILVAT